MSIHDSRIETPTVASIQCEKASAGTLHLLISAENALLPFLYQANPPLGYNFILS